MRQRLRQRSRRTKRHNDETTLWLSARAELLTNQQTHAPTPGANFRLHALGFWVALRGVKEDRLSYGP
ncbi:MAG TPA: hypothetical protein DEP35_16260 [Deltaproteobacteria bacterium]|nr:hypothetical protein [Deltaproteobacteria bacterium]